MQVVDLQLDHVPDQLIDHGDRRLAYGGQGGAGYTMDKATTSATATQVLRSVSAR